MFDLEKSIKEWREQMLAAGVKSPVPLEELESHLCEGIAVRMRSGVDAQKAFESAAREMGEARTLKLEFEKAALPHKDLSKFNLFVNTLFVMCLSFNACWVAPLVLAVTGSSAHLREGWQMSANWSPVLGLVFLAYFWWARRNNPNFTLIFLNLPAQETWFGRQLNAGAVRLERASAFRRVIGIGTASPGALALLCFFAVAGVYGFIWSFGTVIEVCSSSFFP